MASIWTVKPEDVKIDLTFVDEGKTFPFWIKIKKRLTVGESRRVMTAGWRGLRQSNPGARADNAGPEIQIDWKATSFARAEAYLIDWSLTDERETKLAVTHDVIESLHPDVFALIEDAINKHIETAEQEKKDQTGVSEPTTTSV